MPKPAPAGDLRGTPLLRPGRIPCRSRLQPAIFARAWAPSGSGAGAPSYRGRFTCRMGKDLCRSRLQPAIFARAWAPSGSGAGVPSTRTIGSVVRHRRTVRRLSHPGHHKPERITVLVHEIGWRAVRSSSRSGFIDQIPSVGFPALPIARTTLFSGRRGPRVGLISIESDPVGSGMTRRDLFGLEPIEFRDRDQVAGSGGVAVLLDPDEVAQGLFVSAF